MGAAAFVVESAEAARERGIQPICEVLGAVTAISAFHGTRLDVEHIAGVMEAVVSEAERYGVRRAEIAPQTVFVSHETYTPARGGSASAEIHALRTTFGDVADRIVITNTKGFTGHAMGAGVEDVLAIKALETGVVPGVPNYREPDPELGRLNLSTGGDYPVEYALRLAAGFGSQIAMSVLRRTPAPDGRRRAPTELGYGYRVVDPAAWQAWLDGLTGHSDTRLEVDHRRLRAVDVGAPPVPVAAHTRVPVPYSHLTPGPATHPAEVRVDPAEVRVDPAEVRVDPAEVRVDPAEVRVEQPTTAVDPVLAEVTAVVSEMTGYPPELLDPDLDLEADLGVDTVKQAEVFAAVRAEYDVERDDTLQLRDFPTLSSVAGWVREKTGLAAAEAPAVQPTESGGAPSAATESAEPAPAASTDADLVHADLVHADLVQGDLAAIDALPRRIPVPSLRPPADACVATGVALDGARVLVMLDEHGVGEALVGRLERLGAQALTPPPGVTTDDLLGTLDGWLAEGPITGVYWLAALDDDGDLSDDAAWAEATRRRVKALYATMRALWEGSPFLVSATRLGGFHGYDAEGAACTLGGGVTGFTKSYKKERPDALVKAVDLPASRKTAAVADLLVEETLRDPGCVEIGRVDDRRYGVAFREVPFTPLGEDGSPLGEGGVMLGPDSVVVVTGAAGSIVSAITADLAAPSGATFHLLDLAAAPEPHDPDVAAFRSDREGLKRTLMARMQERGERPTPVAIERELAGLERQAAALAALEAVAAAGGRAVYHQVDLTDGAAVAAALGDVGDRVDLLLHAAGLEISRTLPDKAPAEFDLVFDVKVNGWRHVWRALESREVGAVVVFSSVAGRFGNAGQTDYAAANDLLCKTMSSLRRTRPQTRGLALDWTAWGGIGMATRGSIPTIMAAAGVQMLPPEAGVAWIRRELASGPYSGEVIVAGALGMMAAEYHPGGGLEETDGYAGAMLGPVSLSVHDGLVVDLTLDPTEQPFLDHHRIDGTPVLPGVMGMEAFAEAARLLAPEGYQVRSVEDVSFLAPVKFYRDEPRTLRVSLTTEPAGEDLLAHAVLSAERVLPGHDAAVRTVHFTGTVRLSTAPPEAGREEVDLAPADRRLSPEQVYSFYFHGPAYQVVDEAWRSDGAALARLNGGLPSDHEPPEAPLVEAPRLVELCFQAAGLWQAGRDGELALPLAVGRVEVVDTDTTGDLVAVARQTGHSTYDARVVTADGRVVVRLDGYRCIPVP
ncbi:MAG: SDR family NAD(P)-dependent oxidoreductase, partial [Nocardioides sp.]